MKILYLPNQYSQQRQKEKPVWVYPVLLAMQAEWYRKNGHTVYWGESPEAHDHDCIIIGPENIDFLELPMPDRIFTDAFNPKYQKYGNYKYHPATHIQVADGCWHGKCVFCVEQGKPFLVRPIDSIMAEIEECERLGFKELFDDSGTFPDGEWCENFCVEQIKRHTRTVFGCNMRINGQVDFRLMKAAGFRMVLFGVESANQETLNKINKGVDANDIISTIRRASESGLEPHIAVMFGYPWETESDECKTLSLVHYLLRKGFAKTAQASLYDVEGVSATDRGMCKRIYSAAKYPDFWANKIKDLTDWADVKYLLKSIRKGIIRD